MSPVSERELIAKGHSLTEEINDARRSLQDAERLHDKKITEAILAGDEPPPAPTQIEEISRKILSLQKARESNRKALAALKIRQTRDSAENRKKLRQEAARRLPVVKKKALKALAAWLEVESAAAPAGVRPDIPGLLAREHRQNPNYLRGAAQ